MHIHIYMYMYVYTHRELCLVDTGTQRVQIHGITADSAFLLLWIVPPRMLVRTRKSTVATVGLSTRVDDRHQEFRLESESRCVAMRVAVCFAG